MSNPPGPNVLMITGFVRCAQTKQASCSSTDQGGGKRRFYPSVIDPPPDEIKDRGQVRAMWQWARDLDRDNLLWREFCRPIEIEMGSKEDLAIQLTEGWILGCSRRPFTT